jgi:hypothetical protein
MMNCLIIILFRIFLNEHHHHHTFNIPIMTCDKMVKNCSLYLPTCYYMADPTVNASPSKLHGMVTRDQSMITLLVLHYTLQTCTKDVHMPTNKKKYSMARKRRLKYWSNHRMGRRLLNFFSNGPCWIWKKKTSKTYVKLYLLVFSSPA